ncbi:hypothetical protein JSO19_00740 [Leucobacter sp. UCMA 4100]|uniref:hypothetical protein n=1 Tax=Leucobacter sp. UCMA 4100 TaxID=2810534 RepID=UPI0022EB2464|nr:hypothetical protein [Leucobacter sp. UCMA 4100]MDA3145903.1 hypothetical protein [Leucobacter sp. UCMA 4100]
MRKLTWLITGVGIGFVAAHFVNQTPEGRKFFDRIGQGAREFNGAMQDGYRQGGEALLEDVEEALKKLRDKAE